MQEMGRSDAAWFMQEMGRSDAAWFVGGGGEGGGEGGGGLWDASAHQATLPLQIQGDQHVHGPKGHASAADS